VRQDPGLTNTLLGGPNRLRHVPIAEKICYLRSSILKKMEAQLEQHRELFGRKKESP